MIKVECPSCQASYDLDERRVPAKGMKMRCPKCSASFFVLKDGTTQEGAGPSLPAPPPAAAPVATKAAFTPKGTMLGGAVPPPAAPSPAASSPAASKSSLSGQGSADSAPPRGPNLGSHTRPMGAFGNPTATLLGTASPVADAPPRSLPPPPPKPAAPARPAPAHKPSTQAAPSPKSSAGAFGGAPRKATMLGLNVPASAMAGNLSLQPNRAAEGSDSSDLPAVKSAEAPSTFALRSASDPSEDADLPAARKGPIAPAFPAGVSLGPKPAPAAPRPEALAPPFTPRANTPPRAAAPATPPASHDAQVKGEVDLPAFKAPPAPAAMSFPKPVRDPSLPPPAPSLSSDQEEDELDLPAPKANQGADLFGEVELDLPGLPDLEREREAFAALQAPDGGGFGDIDLDLPAPRSPSEPSWDLPKPRAERSSAFTDEFGDADPLGGVDLPTLSESEGGTRERDLPAPVLGFDEDQIDLPVARGGSDLPAPTGHTVDLPTPATRGETDLPALPGFGDLDLMLPDSDSSASVSDLPTPAGSFGDLELPAPLPAAGLVTPRERTVQGVTQPLEGESELPPSLMSDDESSFGDIDLTESDPSPRLPEPVAATNRLTDGLSEPPLANLDTPTTDFGQEGEFGGEDEEELYEDEDMEFGIDPEDSRSFSLPPEVLRRRAGPDFEEVEKSRGKRALMILVGAGIFTVFVALVGVGLGMFTQYGYFGIYYIEQFLPEAASPEFARTEIERAETVAKSDTYGDAQRSLIMLGEARGKAGLNRPLLTRSLMHEAYNILRYGDSPQGATHAAAIRRRLEERGNDAEGITLAHAADHARMGEWSDASAKLKAAERQTPADPYIQLLRGEVALAQGDGKVSEAAFAQALQQNAGAKAHFGLARAAKLQGKEDALASAIEATLKESPRHAEALMESARLQWARGNRERALAELNRGLGVTPVDGQSIRPSPKAKAAGLALLGYIEERSGHLHLARKAYEDSLAADPSLIDALLGAGRVLLRERRASDAVARFDAAANAASKAHNPTVLGGRPAEAEAQLGRARALLLLNRAPEAKTILAQLATTLPDDQEIARALGRAYEELNDVYQAEEQYRRAIALAPKVFDGYLALSQLHARQDRADKASEVLNEAAAHVEETAEMRRMLGRAELNRNRLRGAVHEFERALELDPADLEAKFGLGQALRKSGEIADARKAFDAIAEVDPAFAGLALERGLLLESQGEYDAAIKNYQAALSEQPSDTALLLRLGAAQVESARFDDAEATLDKVLHSMPNSAEAEYFIGRVAFGRGRTPDALTHFDRALALDATQGEFHLYAARATLDMGNLGRAMEEAQRAIERDSGLGDAFWTRGQVRLRMGAVQDALRDFQHALKLNPNRVDAYAGIAESHDQLGQRKAAVEAFQEALRRAPERGDWWYRLAQVQQDSGNRGEAERLVGKAIEFGDAQSIQPYWLADAYRIAGDLARTSGNRKTATGRYLRYLEIAPDGHVDRRTVQDQLEKWEVSWRKDDY